MSMDIAFIGRASCYSPQSVEKDYAILSAVRKRLQATCRCLDIVQEDASTEFPLADGYVVMGRNEHTLQWLATREKMGIPVVNSTASIRLCNHRSKLTRQLAAAGVAVPPPTGCDGYWVKRGKGCRMTDEDVQYAATPDDALRLKQAMLRRGIQEVEVRAHVVGWWVKFYGVHDTGFFRCYRMNDGEAQPVELPSVQLMAERAAKVAELAVYGGDAIIKADGQPVLVDLNDWPSFSPCREEAAVAIAQRVVQRINS